ncbi:UxaA family hydrolase [Marinovum sp.]|uniref:UxaA family hydrolase n=1 Tax=Marinovum sp. TaxID=2024839 RepID=UPI002B2753E7|nr:UxaA family hydrolase [Marinovum sp.]
MTAAKAHTVAAEDMVAYLLAPVAPGAEVTVQGARTGEVTAREAIAAFHKIALRDIAAGETLWRGGWPIGRAGSDIAAGAHVHTHNLVSAHSTKSKEDR